MRISRIFLAVLLCGFAPAVSAAEDTLVPSATLSAIYNSGAPTFGNARADVTIVEFYDYRCGYCKASEKGLEQLLQEDKNLRIIFMDFPKLGSMSNAAARATLAAKRQGMDKYLRFHFLLMNGGGLTDDVILKSASAVGLDVDKIKRDMKDPAIAAAIQNNIALGKSAGVRVTPDFIVGGYFYPGYATYDQLKERIAYARGAGR